MTMNNINGGPAALPLNEAAFNSLLEFMSLAARAACELPPDEAADLLRELTDIAFPAEPPKQ